MYLADLFSYMNSVHWFYQKYFAPSFCTHFNPNICPECCTLISLVNYGILRCRQALETSTIPKGLVGQMQSSRNMYVLKCESDLMNNFFGCLISTFYIFSIGYFIYCLYILIFQRTVICQQIMFVVRSLIVTKERHRKL